MIKFPIKSHDAVLHWLRHAYKLTIQYLIVSICSKMRAMTDLCPFSGERGCVNFLIGILKIKKDFTSHERHSRENSITSITINLIS
jgi:hypothetical protein